MIIPKNYDELAQLIETNAKVVLFFTADWCPDCRFIYPVMPEIEAENDSMTFVQVNRDDFMAVAQEWNILEFQVLWSLKMGKNVGVWLINCAKLRLKLISF